MGDRRVARLTSLAHTGFRNLATATFVPDARFNVISGDNGEGKSNLLEAIHYLLSLASFRTSDSETLVQHGTACADLRGLVEGQPIESEYRVTLPREGSRSIAIDGKRPRALRDWWLRAPTVVFHPAELALASGGAGERRAFLDRILQISDPTYADVLRSYNEALRSRNRLLKEPGVDVRAVRAYDTLLANSGAVLMLARESLVRRMTPIAENTFAEVMGQHVQLALRYRPDVEEISSNAVLAALESSWQRDQRRTHTKRGPHADELELTLAGARGIEGAARSFASQGQQRLIVLALKLAELDLLTLATNTVPIVLLDDVSSELDATRRQRLFERLRSLGGQVFLSTTHADFVRLEGSRTDFLVTAGVISRAAST